MTRPRPTYAFGRELHQFWFASDNLEELESVARRLAVHAPRPLRRKLVIFAETCRTNPDRADAAWLRIKQQLVVTGMRR